MLTPAQNGTNKLFGVKRKHGGDEFAVLVSDDVEIVRDINKKARLRLTGYSGHGRDDWITHTQNHAALPLVNLRYASISNRLPRPVLIQSEPKVQTLKI